MGPGWNPNNWFSHAQARIENAAAVAAVDDDDDDYDDEIYEKAIKKQLTSPRLIYFGTCFLIGPTTRGALPLASGTTYNMNIMDYNQGPVVQNFISITSLLRPQLVK